MAKLLLVGRVCAVDWVGANVADDPIAEVTLVAALLSGKWETVTIGMFGDLWPCTRLSVLFWVGGLDRGSGVSGLGLRKVGGLRPGDVDPF